MSASIEFPFPTIIKNLDTPVDDSDSATKGYVDGYVVDYVAEAIDAADVVLSVNGVLPVNNNVNISLVGTSTGPLADRPLPGTNPVDGSMYIVSGDPTPELDGSAYVYVASSSTWVEISPPGQASSDARYVLKSGDTMTGDLIRTNTTGSTTVTSNLGLSGLTHSILIGAANTVSTYNAFGVQLTDGTQGDTDLRPGSLILTNPDGTPSLPAQNDHATTKLYVDQRDALKLSLTGGTLTGALTLSGAPTSNLHAVTKKYVDDFNAIGNVASLDFVRVSFNLDYTLPGADQVIRFDKVNDLNGSVAYSSSLGAFLLKAGKTYNLRASINGTCSTVAQTTYAWTVGGGSTAVVGGSTIGVVTTITGKIDAIGSVADAFYTAPSDINVYLRVKLVSGGAIIAKPDTQVNFGSSWASVIQVR